MSSASALVAKGRALVETDNQRFGVSWRNAVLIALVPMAIVGLVALLGVAAHFARDTFRPIFLWVTAEDSLLEWPQFFFALAASLIFGRISLQLLGLGQRGIALLYLLIAVGTFFVAGEEISWGQRVFGWGTPESLAAVNHQVETNVHNIRFLQRLFGFVVLFGGLYGALAPVLRSLTLPRLEFGSLTPLIIPALCTVPAFLMPFGYRLIRVLILPSPNVLVVRYGEAPELCLYIGLFVFAWLNTRRLEQPALERAAPILQP